MIYLTIQEASDYLKVPKGVVYAKWRQLGGGKIGRHIRIPRESIDEYMTGHKEDVSEWQSRPQYSDLPIEVKKEMAIKNPGAWKKGLRRALLKEKNKELLNESELKLIKRFEERNK
jgi:excisionase family DNA binding protein